MRLGHNRKNRFVSRTQMMIILHREEGKKLYAHTNACYQTIHNTYVSIKMVVYAIYQWPMPRFRWQCMMNVIPFVSLFFINVCGLWVEQLQLLWIGFYVEKKIQCTQIINPKSTNKNTLFAAVVETKIEKQNQTFANKHFCVCVFECYRITNAKQ